MYVVEFDKNIHGKKKTFYFLDIQLFINKKDKMFIVKHNKNVHVDVEDNIDFKKW